MQHMNKKLKSCIIWMKSTHFPHCTNITIFLNWPDRIIDPDHLYICKNNLHLLLVQFPCLWMRSEKKKLNHLRYEKYCWRPKYRVHIHGTLSCSRGPFASPQLLKNLSCLRKLDALPKGTCVPSKRLKVLHGKKTWTKDLLLEVGLTNTLPH